MVTFESVNQSAPQPVSATHPAGDDGKEKQNDADQGDLGNLARPQIPQVHAHEQRDGDGHRDREHSPRGLGERIDDHKSEHRDEDDHDDEHADQCGDAADEAEFFAGHLTEAAPAALRRDPQDHEVLHRPGEHDADDDPDRSR